MAARTSSAGLLSCSPSFVASTLLNAPAPAFFLPGAAVAVVTRPTATSTARAAMIHLFMRTSFNPLLVETVWISGVPVREDPRLALVAELADRGGVQQQVRAVRRGELEPARAQHAQDVPVGEQRDVTVGRQRRVRSPGPRVRPRRPRSPRRASRRPTASSPAASPGSPASSGLRSRRSRPRPGRRRPPARSPPAAPSPGRCRGELNTSANSWPASRFFNVTAFSRPRWVSGMSVVDVCLPEALHSVSPWRMSTILIRRSSWLPRSRRRRASAPAPGRP